MAKDFSKVTGVDISPKNISDAVSNAGINGIDNVEFICDDSEKYSRLKGLSAIILDPPRAGLGKKAKLCVAESGVEHVVYVSCNPANLAKDLAELGAAYSIESLIPVDMFPHTRHLEVVAILRRNRV